MVRDRFKIGSGWEHLGLGLAQRWCAGWGETSRMCRVKHREREWRAAGRAGIEAAFVFHGCGEIGGRRLAHTRGGLEARRSERERGVREGAKGCESEGGVAERRNPAPCENICV